MSTSLTQNDHCDLGVLLGFALQPLMRPGSRPEYRRVLARYRAEVDFRSAMDALLDGLDTQVLSDGEFGLVLGVRADSPFAFRWTDMPYTGKRDNRLVLGLILVAVAAYAYPTPTDLDDDRVRRVAEVEFESWLREACERMRVHDASGELIPDEGLDQAWRVYVAMPSTQFGKRGRGAGRLSSECSRYWVRAGLSWLAEQGMARADVTGTSGAWTLTERFRAHVRDMAADSAYTAMAAFARGERPPAEQSQAHGPTPPASRALNEMSDESDDDDQGSEGSSA